MLKRKLVKDQMGFMINVPEEPMRMVSLVPSQTELLCDLGMEQRLYGITKFCIHPEEVVSQKTKVGGTKTFHIEAIKVLNPDLIIANKEENDEELILKLKQHFPVWISDVRNLDQCRKMIGEVGELVGKKNEAAYILEKVESGFANLPKPRRKVRTAYLIWRKPYMSVNADTFIHDIMDRCGMENVFAGRNGRYPEITDDDLTAAKPELILLSTEPYPFSEKHFEEIEKILPDTSVVLADGEMFSWYGSRMMFAPVYLEKLVREVIIPVSEQ